MTVRDPVVLTSTSSAGTIRCPMLVQCRANVIDGGPTLDQHRAKVLCRLRLFMMNTITVLYMTHMYVHVLH